MDPKLSTHVLDTAQGRPARGMQIELWWLAEEAPRLMKTVRTNADGRTDQALLAGKEVKVGRYELVFFVGDYFAETFSLSPSARFLDRVPVRFSIADPQGSYHVPLLVSPWAYTTYRGS